MENNEFKRSELDRIKGWKRLKLIEIKENKMELNEFNWNITKYTGMKWKRKK